MALIECTECGNKVSDRASACPNCGCPVSDILLDIKRNDAFDMRETKQKSSNVSKKFIKEISGRSIGNLEFLKRTQQDFYSAEEMKIICETIEKKKHMTGQESSNGDYEVEQSSGYSFHYIISFLIPLVGFILGAIMMSKEDYDERLCGKKCIVMGILSMIIYLIALYVKLCS